MAFTTANLSLYHSFSKMPAQNSTTLGNAINKSGHTVTASEVWAQDIPYYGKMGSLEDVKSKVQPYARKNDMCYITAGADKGKTFQYDGNGNWTDITATLVDGALIKNANDDVVLLYHKGQTLTNLTADNNANTDSANNAARLWAKRDTEGVTILNSGTRLIEQFVAPTDKALNGLASVAYAPVIANGTLISGTNYYDYCFSGTILWASTRSTATVIDCFEYVGQKVSTVVDTVTTNAAEIKAVKDQVDTISESLGLGATPGQDTLGSRVSKTESAIRTMLGLDSDADIVASQSISQAIAAAVSDAEGRVKVTTDALQGAIDTLNGTETTTGSVAKAVADAEGRVKVTTDALAGRIAQLEGIAHFSVEVVDALPTAPVENTIYLVAEEGVAEGNYIEYIAYKPKDSESVVTEKIGSTALDLSGYTTDAEYEALAGETGRVTVVEGKVTTLEGQVATLTGDATTAGSVAKALADAKTYAEEQASAAQSAAESTAAGELAAAVEQIGKDIEAAKNAAIASAEVTITAGTGIVVTPEGKGTTFEISVSDAVATASDLTALTGRVTTLETTTVPGIDTRLQAAEATITSLTEEGGVIDGIEGEIAALATTIASETGRVTEVEGKVSDIETSLAEGGATANAIKAAQDTADAKVASVSGPETGLVTVTGDKDVTITVSDTIATKDYADTAASTAITTSLAGTKPETIGGAISSAVNALESKLTTGEGSLGTKVSALEDSVKTINETTIPNAITAAQNGAVTTVKALTLNASDSDDAAKVTVTLGGTVETPTITVTSSDIASAQTLSELSSKVNTHIEEAAGLYLSVEKVSQLPADAEAKTNKIYLVPVDTEEGRAQNIHTEYIWTNGQWEIIGTTAIDINSLEASAKAAQDAADKAQGEVDAVEEAIAAMDADLTVNGISVKQVDGKVTELSESLITASVPADTTSVEGNVAYVGSTKHVIAPDKFQTAAQMPSTLTSWVADLSNLTVGDNMFKGCTGLTVFVGDLSSLTSGVDMFNGCTLDAESLEILAENLPAASGTIDIGASTNATDEVIATIKGKGWTLKSNGTAL